jgi:hypothetical protein
MGQNFDLNQDNRDIIEFGNKYYKEYINENSNLIKNIIFPRGNDTKYLNENNICFLPNINDTIIFDGGISDSVKLTDKIVFIKMFIKTREVPNGYFDSLFTEAYIYSIIIPVLLKSYSPCFIKNISYSICPGLYNNLDEKYKKHLKAIYKNKSEESWKNEIIHIIINEAIKSDTINMYDYMDKIQEKIENKDFSWLSELKNILFQTYWALMSLSKIGVRHNDLHLGNIFIEELKTPIIEIYRFIYKGQLYVFRLIIRKRIKIFDWDRGSFVGVIRNYQLEENDKNSVCKRGGGCNNINTGYDSYKFSCGMLQYISSFRKKEKDIFLKITNYFYDFGIKSNSDFCSPIYNINENKEYKLDPKFELMFINEFKDYIIDSNIMIDPNIFIYNIPYINTKQEIINIFELNQKQLISQINTTELNQNQSKINKREINDLKQTNDLKQIKNN